MRENSIGRLFGVVLLALLVAGCGSSGSGKDKQPQREVSERERALAECEMQALEVIPDSPSAAERIERHTRLCMQARGYPTDSRQMQVIIRNGENR